MRPIKDLTARDSALILTSCALNGRILMYLRGTIFFVFVLPLIVEWQEREAMHLPPFDSNFRNE